MLVSRSTAGGAAAHLELPRPREQLVDLAVANTMRRWDGGTVQRWDGGTVRRWDGDAVTDLAVGLAAEVLPGPETGVFGV
jgi:hypothetical protein